ncbi:hypothetical protein ATCC90586_004165 [Pythium insidiosum]|nr:hypothetical protein ATCC90586_004165 [Pythium insidiosum]
MAPLVDNFYLNAALPYAYSRYPQVLDPLPLPAPAPAPVPSRRHCSSASLPGAFRSQLRSCRLLGCAKLSQVQGYCADHFHAEDLGHQEDLGSPSPLAAPVTQPTLPPISCMLQTPARRIDWPSLSPAAPTYARPDLRRSISHPPSTEWERVQAGALSSRVSQTQRQATCRRDNCWNPARRKGLCVEHGGRHFCKIEGCTKCAHRGGFCIAHGGGRRCGVPHCSKSAQSGGVCYAHGGGKRCAVEDCSHAARSGGFCINHGKLLKQNHAIV